LLRPERLRRAATLALMALGSYRRGDAERARALLLEASRLVREEGALASRLLKEVPALRVHEDLADLLEDAADAVSGSAGAQAALAELLPRLSSWSRRLFGAPCTPPGYRGEGGVVQPWVAVGAAASCLSALADYLESSRCAVEGDASPRAVRACALADYAFRVMEREGMLYKGAPDSRALLGSWAPPQPRVSRSALMRGEAGARRSVLGQLRARASGSAVELELDYGKRARVDFGSGEAVVEGVPRYAAEAVSRALERAAGLKCAVEPRGRRAAVRCTGVALSNADEAVAAAAMAANIDARVQWHRYLLDREEYAEVAAELARRVARELSKGV
jgi:hypothetical protein